MVDPVAIVVRKGEGFAFAEWSDLKGRKGVTNAGESYGDEFDAFMAKELTVARAAGVDKAFAALLAQQADYMIIGLFRAAKKPESWASSTSSNSCPRHSYRLRCMSPSPSNPNAARCGRDSPRDQDGGRNGTVRQLLEPETTGLGR